MGCSPRGHRELRPIFALLVSLALLLSCGCGKTAKPAPETTVLPDGSSAPTTGPALTESAAPTAPPSADAPTQPSTLPPTTEAPTVPPETESAAAPATLTTNGSVIPLSALEHRTEDKSAPVVFFTKEISADALRLLYVFLAPELPGKIAVKLATGESQMTNFLKPELIGPLVQDIGGTIVECMTAFGGVRSSALLHKQAAKDRGYTDVAPFDLLDEDGDAELPLTGGTRLKKAIVGSHIRNYDSVLVLTHFKGHPMAGFGGAIKNVGIGMSSKKGKIYVHSAGTRTVGIVLHYDQDAWLEALAEAVKAVSDYKNNGANMRYISVMNRLSVDCDCVMLPQAPDMHDIGMLASEDPVALDQACVDLIYAAPDGGSVIARMESLNGVHVLEHAERIGLGSRQYRLVCID